MQHILIAVFEDRSAAENAQTELLASGFSKQEVKISRADPTGETDSTTGRPVMPLAEEPHKEGVIDSIRHFFHDLFGTDTSPHAQRYTDAVGRGHNVLTVTAADEPEVERAADIVEKHGPVDIDEHAMGWAGGAPVARSEAMRMSGAGGMQQGAGMSAQSAQSPQSAAQSAQRSQMAQKAAEDFQSGLAGESGTVAPEHRQPFQQQSLQDATPMGSTYQEPMGGGGNLSSGTTTGASYQGGAAPWPGEGSMQRDTSVARAPLQQRQTIGNRDVQRGGVRVFTAVVATVAPVSSDDEAYFRRDWKGRYGAGGGRYEDYAPAYSYGAEMAASDRFRGRKWHEIENDMRTSWDSRFGASGQPSTWERMKDAVREGWDRITDELGLRDDDYRKHWTSNYASSGGSYDDYAPAYRYGAEMAGSSKYRGRSWTDVENDLKSDWDARYAGQPSTWDKIKAAVRHGWDRITGDSGVDSDSDKYYRSHWNSNYAATGGLYDEYAPAYRYGSEMAGSDQYRGRSWSDIESDLKSGWEQRHGSGAASTWERFKAAVRHGWERISADTDMNDAYRSHWKGNYADSGGSYDDYAPAYRYGSQMASSDKYRGRKWNDVESDLKSDWDTRYGSDAGSTWERFKAAIRHGWERITS